MNKENMILAGLTDKQIHLLFTPFSRLSAQDREDAFRAADKVGEYNRKQPLLMDCSLASRDINALFNKDSIISPADGRAYSNRSQWNEMLKRNNCVEFGNDQKMTSRPVQLKNMNLKPAIAEALKRHTK